MAIDVTTRWIAGGVLEDGQTIAYPAVYNRQEAWAFVLKHYPGHCLVRHVRATVDNMPAKMSPNETPLFFDSLE